MSPASRVPSDRLREMGNSGGRFVRRPTNLTTPAPAIWLYAFSPRDPTSGAWQELCRPGPDGLTLAFPLPGYFTDDGSYIADAQKFTITCTGGAIGKCVRFGYRP